MSDCKHALCGADNRPGRWPNGWLRVAVAGTGRPARWFCSTAHLLEDLDPAAALALRGQHSREEQAQARAARRREGVAQLLREGRSVSQIVSATGEPAVWVKGVLDELRAEQVHA